MSPTPTFDFSGNHRTKEENQERAFIAASRRKDRSLDARIESANRASMLHKQRTGRALHIDRQIVESEAMYEEIDSNYQAKLQRMMQAQNMQLEQDLERKLFVAMRNSPQALHQRRASSLTSQGPLHGGRKMSLDLSQLRASLSEPITSPMGSLHSANVMVSPRTNLSPSFSLTPAQAQAQVPSYVASGAPTWMHPRHQQMMQHWEAFCSNNSMSPSAIGGIPMHPRQFRDRLASAPTIPVQSQAGTPVAASAAPHGMSQHSRVRSEPGTIVAPTTTSSSSSSSLHTSSGLDSNSPSLAASSSSELPDLCLSPHTPISQASGLNNFPNPDSTNTHAEPVKWNTDFLQDWDPDVGVEMFPREPADQDYIDFSQFASTLDNNGHATTDCHPQAHAQMQMHIQLPVQFDSTNADLNDGPNMAEYIAG
ncbi:hypothetical protein BDW59DRAFT_142952 [Aspergillus cavernicola]|uniref:BZIP domain-containing protein n=1 Tax=Aspergillus cavernicola TaxID=176166 RepID=A0ABR4ILT5_9EURO